MWAIVTATGICSYGLRCDFMVSFKNHTSAFLKVTLELPNYLLCASCLFPPRGVLKYQTNIEAHPPGCLRANQSGTEQQGEELEQAEDEERRCGEEAHFQPHYPQVRVFVCVCVGAVCLLCFSWHFHWFCAAVPVKCVYVEVGVVVRVCWVFGKCWRELVLFIRGVVPSGRGRHPLFTSRPVFVCVITCLHMVVKQRAGSIKSPLNPIVLSRVYGRCEQLACYS